MRVVILVGIAVAAIVIAMRMRSDSDTPATRIERLRAAIDNSSLPQHAQNEMRALINDGRLQPSQYLKRSTSG